jgi:hypothetical protein
MVSLLVLPPSQQAGRLVPTPHVGNNYEINVKKMEKVWNNVHDGHNGSFLKYLIKGG